jgi:hypothetical protein
MRHRQALLGVPHGLMFMMKSMLMFFDVAYVQTKNTVLTYGGYLKSAILSGKPRPQIFKREGDQVRNI